MKRIIAPLLAALAVADGRVVIIALVISQRMTLELGLCDWLHSYET